MAQVTAPLNTLMDEAQSVAYREQVNALSAQGVALVETLQVIGAQGVRSTLDVLASGGGAGDGAGNLGTLLLLESVPRSDAAQPCSFALLWVLVKRRFTLSAGACGFQQWRRLLCPSSRKQLLLAPTKTRNGDETGKCAAKNLWRPHRHPLVSCCGTALFRRLDRRTDRSGIKHLGTRGAWSLARAWLLREMSK